VRPEGNAFSIEGDPGDGRMVGTGAGFIDVVVENPPQPGVVLAHQAADGGDRHRDHHRHGKRFE
jgi:hypothetical protein